MSKITHYGLFRENVPNSPMIKEAQFFLEQSENQTHTWSKSWEPIFDCETIGDARRAFAEKHGVELSPIYHGEA